MGMQWLSRLPQTILVSDLDRPTFCETVGEPWKAKKWRQANPHWGRNELTLDTNNFHRIRNRPSKIRKTEKMGRATKRIDLVFFIIKPHNSLLQHFQETLVGGQGGYHVSDSVTKQIFIPQTRN